jgi:predicted TIM-barrel fold metal-dependent hydrolase
MPIEELIESYRAVRKQLQFFDSNLWIGYPAIPEFEIIPDISTLTEYLKRYDIVGGVVTHIAAKDYSPLEANEWLLASLQDAPGFRLWGNIVLLPDMFPSKDAGRAYLLPAIARGARMARVFPAAHRFSLSDWCIGSKIMLQLLEELQMPLVVWHTEVSWDEVEQLCRTYPALPIIVEGTPRKILYHTRFYYPLLKQYPNLYIELHSLINYMGVEEIVELFGARRLIFGSYMSFYDPNAVIMQVTHARISVEQKMSIARGNLLELTSKVREQ